MNKAEVERYEKLDIQIHGIYNELGVLSKKSPDSAINKFKLGFVNQLLSEANSLLGIEQKPFKNFELFDSDDIPSNSDVVLVVSQYISCLERLKRDNVKMEGGRYIWNVSDYKWGVETSRPELSLD